MTTKRFTALVALWGLLIGWWAPSLSADLPDPTRPPGMLMAPKAPMPGASAPVGATEAAKPRVEAPRSARLSAIMLADAPGRSTEIGRAHV